MSLLANFCLFFMMTRMLPETKGRSGGRMVQGIELVRAKSPRLFEKKAEGEDAGRPVLPEAPSPLNITELPALPLEKPPHPFPISEAPAELESAGDTSFSKIIEAKAPRKGPPELVEHHRIGLLSWPERLHQEKGLLSPQVKKTSSPPGKIKPVDSQAAEAGLMPLLRTRPRYPRRAIRARIEGWVTVKFKILSDGSVSEPVVLDSVPSRIFDRAALSAIQHWKFRAVKTKGKAPVRRAIQNIRFSLKAIKSGKR